MPAKNISVREIARLTGFSISTVSRVLNNARNVSEETRAKIQRVINEYNYVPNISAKNLFSKHSRTVAIFILDIFNPFFASLVKELSAIAINNDYALFICDTENDPEIERKYINYCIGIRVKGVIFTEGNMTNITAYHDDSINFVFHDRFHASQASSVDCDNKKGIDLAVDYLYNLNHRRFAFVGYSENIMSACERRDAFIAALRKKGINISENNIIPGDLTFETGALALNAICALPEKPTAVICCNDQIAKGFIVKANSINMKIPEDFSVIGFDGVDNHLFYPKLTTVRQNVHHIAEKLFALATKAGREVEHHTIDVALDVRDSCQKWNDPT